MARITPPTQQTDLSQLKDHEPYRVFIRKTDFEASSAEYGGEKRLVIDWAFADDPDFTVRDWVSLRLGRQQSGQVSKLRMILNAVAHKPKAEDIAWFDDEDLTWSYDGEHVACKLSEGLEAIIRGEVTEKPGDNGPKRRFRINVYSPAVEEKPNGAKRGPQPVTTPLGRPKSEDGDGEEPPF
jgi:hypothetical protein